MKVGGERERQKTLGDGTMGRSIESWKWKSEADD